MEILTRAAAVSGARVRILVRLLEKGGAYFDILRTSACLKGRL